MFYEYNGELNSGILCFLFVFCILFTSLLEYIFYFFYFIFLIKNIIIYLSKERTKKGLYIFFYIIIIYDSNQII